jgi:hypothetical protein
LEQLRDIPIPIGERYVLSVGLGETTRAYGTFATGSTGRTERSYSATFTLYKSTDLGKSVFSSSSGAESSYDTALTSGEVVFAIFNSIDDSLLEQVSMGIVEHVRTYFLKAPKP